MKWSFSQALLCLRAGGKIRRVHWWAGQFIYLDGLSIVDSVGNPWLPSYPALLADDWEMVAS